MFAWEFCSKWEKREIRASATPQAERWQNQQIKTLQDLTHHSLEDVSWAISKKLVLSHYFHT